MSTFDLNINDTLYCLPNLNLHYLSLRLEFALQNKFYWYGIGVKDCSIKPAHILKIYLWLTHYNWEYRNP
jgi:hypothetical protein